MACEIEIVGDPRWDEIVACEDEVQRWRLVRKYIFDLKQGNRQLKDNLSTSEANMTQLNSILDLPIVKDYVKKKVQEATEDWSGVWG